MTYETILSCPRCGFEHRLVADLAAIERMAGAAGSGEIPAMPIAARAREALASLATQVQTILAYCDSCDEHGGLPSTATIRALASLSNPDGEKPEGREGIVTVYDSMTGAYLGCMGRETWEQMLSNPDGEA